MATSINPNAPWVGWLESLMGGKSRQTHAATFPPDRYYCLLDELPLHLVPQTARQRFVDEDRPLVLNPECRLLFAEELPKELQESGALLSGFALQGTIAWVPAESRKSATPFWLGPQLESVVRSLRPMQPVSSSFPSRERALLAAANILVPETGIAERPSAQRGQSSRRARNSFREKGYAPLPSLIHPFHVAALRRYYRNRIRGGAMPLGDRQSSRRYAAYNDPVARFFHHQITSAVSHLAGEELKPSYVYFASYLSGAELKKHVDRPQCEFSVTFCLDYSPEPEHATPWPIRLQTPTGTVAVYQALGDGLAYRGTRLPHYRTPLGESQTSTSIFFHYVREDFDGPLG
jgi:hypothetical protein